MSGRELFRNGGGGGGSPAAAAKAIGSEQGQVQKFDASFISIQSASMSMPVWALKKLSNSPFQEVCVSGLNQSGKTVGPDHTTPLKIVPLGYLRKTSGAVPFK